MPFDPDVSLSAGLRADDFILRPITAADARLDHEAVMDSREYLRRWEQSSWPEDDFTVDDNESDLVDLERWNSENLAFTYTMLDSAEVRCLGCVYIFPPDAKFLKCSEIIPTTADAGEWSDVDAAVYHWVRRQEMEAGMDGTVLTELMEWIRVEWGFDRIVFVTNEQFGAQEDLFRRFALGREFAIRQPEAEGTYFAYGPPTSRAKPMKVRH